MGESKHENVIISDIFVTYVYEPVRGGPYLN